MSCTLSVDPADVAGRQWWPWSAPPQEKRCELALHRKKDVSWHSIFWGQKSPFTDSRVSLSNVWFIEGNLYRMSPALPHSCRFCGPFWSSAKVMEICDSDLKKLCRTARHLGIEMGTAWVSPAVMRRCNMASWGCEPHTLAHQYPSLQPLGGYEATWLSDWKVILLSLSFPGTPKELHVLKARGWVSNLNTRSYIGINLDETMKKASSDGCQNYGIPVHLQVRRCESTASAAGFYRFPLWDCSPFWWLPHVPPFF